jgi:hypothetical protein
MESVKNILEQKIAKEAKVRQLLASSLRIQPLSDLSFVMRFAWHPGRRTSSSVSTRFDDPQKRCAALPTCKGHGFRRYLDYSGTHIHWTKIDAGRM